MSDFDTPKSQCEELCNQPQETQKKVVENSDKAIIIKGLRYLKENRHLSWHQIGNLMDYSHARVIELKFNKKFPTSQKKLSQIITKLEEAIKQVKGENGTKSL